MAKKRIKPKKQYAIDFPVSYEDSIKTLKELLAKKPGGKLTQAEGDLAVALMASGASDEILADLGLESSTALEEQLSQSLMAASNGENYFDTLRERVARGEAAQDLTAGFNLLSDITQSAVGGKQIRDAKGALRSLSRPPIPTVPGRDERLTESIYQAQRGTLDAGRAVQPIKEGIDRGYGADLQTARSVAGGQAGTYGALAQTAANRRTSALGGLAPVIDSIRSREQARLDGLLGMRADENQQNFRNQAHNYAQLNQNYDTDRAYAEDRLSAGQSNLFGGLRNIGNDLAVIGSKYHDMKAPSMRQVFRKRQPARSAIKETQDFENLLSYDPYLG